MILQEFPLTTQIRPTSRYRPCPMMSSELHSPHRTIEPQASLGDAGFDRPWAAVSMCLAALLIGAGEKSYTRKVMYK